MHRFVNVSSLQYGLSRTKAQLEKEPGRQFLTIPLHIRGFNGLGIDTKRVRKLRRVFDKTFAKCVRAVPRGARQYSASSRSSRIRSNDVHN
jgi:hypothetical protein